MDSETHDQCLIGYIIFMATLLAFFLGGNRIIHECLPYNNFTKWRMANYVPLSPKVTLVRSHQQWMEGCH